MLPNSQVSQILKSARHAAKWSEVGLAKYLGIDVERLRAIEANPFEATFGEIVRLVRTLEIELPALSDDAPPQFVQRQRLQSSARSVERAGSGANDPRPYYNYYDFARLGRLSARTFLLDVLEHDVTRLAQNNGHLEDSITYVLDGPVYGYWVSTVGDHVTATLRTGDCYHSRAFVPHTYLSPPGKIARIISFTFRYGVPPLDASVVRFLEGQAHEIPWPKEPEIPMFRAKKGVGDGAYRAVDASLLRGGDGLETFQGERLNSTHNGVRQLWRFEPVEAPHASLVEFEAREQVSHWKCWGDTTFIGMDGTVQVTCGGEEFSLAQLDSLQIPAFLPFTICGSPSGRALAFQAPTLLSFLDLDPLTDRTWRGVKPITEPASEWAKGQS